jgi:multidrug resistance protein
LALFRGISAILRVVREHRAKLSTLFLIVLIDLVGFGMVIPILPLYAETYRPSPVVFGLLMASYSLMQFLFAPVLGRLSDRVGRRPILIVSLAGACVGYLMLGLAGSLSMLFVSRVIAGISGANISTAQAVIADITGPETRAKGMGIIGAAFGLGFILGPAFGGLLVGIRPWLPGVAASGTSLIALGMTLLLLPETLNPDSRDRAAHAPFNVRRLRDALAHPFLGLCLAVVFLLVLAFSAFEVTFAQFFSHRYALSPRGVSFLLVYIGVVGAIVQGGLIGMLVRRFGEPRLVTEGTVFVAAGLGALPYLGGLGLSGAILAVMAFGLGIANPSLSSLASRLVDPDEVGGVLGIFQSLSSLGRIAGPFTGQLAYGMIGPAWPMHLGAVIMLCAGLASFLLAYRLRMRV